MKNLLSFLFFSLLFSSTLIGQSTSTLIVFAEDGHPFDLILNGVKQNEKPVAKIRYFSFKQKGTF